MWPFTSTSEASGSSTPSLSASPAPTSVTMPADHPPVPTSGSGAEDQCPVDHTARQAWLANATASSSSASHPFHPEAASSSSSVDHDSRLSQSRVISSIPRGTAPPNPESFGIKLQSQSGHAEPDLSPSPSSNGGATKDAAGNWIYPSEQQFFNAMLRKKHNPQAKDMKTIVPIHNAVNEKAWEQVLMWESPFGSERCGGPRLVSFVGRPKDRTPKAWIKTALGYTPPFDRHDWTIDRCGTHVRYVIDFYTGRAGTAEDQGKMAFYLDVRPAVDNWEGIKTRATGWWS